MERQTRLSLIERCGQLIKDIEDEDARCRFVIEQIAKCEEDFDLDPVTKEPETSVVWDFRLDGNPNQIMWWGNPRTDLVSARLLGDLADETQAENRPDLAAQVFDAMRSSKALPLRNRLTATYDLALAQFQQGRNFDALDSLKELLLQTEGVDVPVARKNSWSSARVGDAAFNLLRKIRLFTDEFVDFTKCCGEPPPVPKPNPELAQRMNHLFVELYDKARGGGEIRQDLLAQKDQVMPVLLYRLWKGEDAQPLLVFCYSMGTNAAAALPYIPKYLCFSDNPSLAMNAPNVLGSIGRAAACATPLLILAAEDTGTAAVNAQVALRRVGPAPGRVMPYLARLLYHQNPGVCLRAAKAIIASASLDPKQFPEPEVVSLVRGWWENVGCAKDWKE
jgi:hypothetical protein